MGKSSIDIGGCANCLTYLLMAKDSAVNGSLGNDFIAELDGLVAIVQSRIEEASMTDAEVAK